MKRFFALLVALAGCTRQDVDNAGSAFASAAPHLANDALIVTQVEAKLLSLDADSALHVAVTSHDGDVRLSGKVKDRTTLQRFVSEVRKIRGVKRVAAQITPDEHMPRTKDRLSDFAVAAAVRAQIATQAGVNGLNLHVAAHAGTVMLSGNVATRELRATIVDAARKAPGVKTVIAKIDVAS